jgi:hypothetical protein
VWLRARCGGFIYDSLIAGNRSEREREATANMGVRRYMAGKTIKQTHVHKQAASIVRSLALAGCGTKIEQQLKGLRVSE